MTGIVDFRTELLDENGNPITSSNPLPTTGGGGGGGGSLSDTVYTDAANQLFVYRDTGSGTPVAYAIPAWTSYTPTLPVTATNAILPTGASTSALQTTGNTSLGSIDTKTPALVSGRVPVDGSGVTQPVSGSVSVSNFPATQDVNIVGGSGGNAAASATGSTVPAYADYVGFNVGGNLTGVSSSNPLPVTVGNFPATQAISAASLPLPSGAATETTLSSINTKTPALITVPPDPAVSTSPVRIVGENCTGAGFSAVGASVLDSFFVQTPKVGTGVTYSQASGSLSIVTGTTTNAEFLARSVASFEGAMRMRFSIIASQRIANTNFAVLLADLIGENLSYTINSATSVTVTVPGHTFDATNVGQFVNIAGITGAAGIPGRYAIASVVTGTSITFTVAAWPATGTGTCTLFGRNYVRNLVTGVTATNIAVDAQRNGWATGDTTATINTTASPGTVVQCELTGREIFWSDSLRATATTPNFVTRASRYENIPEQLTDLYVWIWSYNGSTAPASTTTYTLGSLTIENFSNLPVSIEAFRSLGTQNPIPMQVTSGTITTVSTVTTCSTVSAVTSANLAFPGIIADVASAALTTTTTTAALTPTFGIAYSVVIPVTVVSGTSPTLDFSIEESADSGTNWYKVYDFPRITAVGIYQSPTMQLTGNRVRYVQTVGGTTPSFTRAVNRLQSSYPAQPVRQLVDRTIVPTTLSSTTPSIITGDCGNRVQLIINLGAATTPPSIQLQGSDDNGGTWYSIGTTLAGVASSTVQATFTDINSQLTRAIVTSAGTGVTLGYVMIKAHD